MLALVKFGVGAATVFVLIGFLYIAWSSVRDGLREFDEYQQNLE